MRQGVTLQCPPGRGRLTTCCAYEADGMPRGGKAIWRGELRSAVTCCQQGGRRVLARRRPDGERVVNSTKSWPAVDAATTAGRSLRSGSGQQHSGGSLGWNEARPSLCHLTASTAESGSVGRCYHETSPPLRFATDRPSASLAADCETGQSMAKPGQATWVRPLENRGRLTRPRRAARRSAAWMNAALYAALVAAGPEWIPLAVGPSDPPRG